MTEYNALTHALELANHGLPVFPITLAIDDTGHIDKTPANDHGHLGATTDADVIRDMFATAYLRHDARDIGVGLRPGPAGYVVLDPDVKGGQDGPAYADSIGANHTWTVDTPSGGQHRYFRKPDPSIEYSNAKPADWNGLIDVRADGGWVVAPGVVWRGHEWRARAEWSDADIATLYPHLDELLRPRRATRGRRASVDPMTESAHTILVEKHGCDPKLTTVKTNGERTWLHVTRPGKRGGVSGSLGLVGPAVLHLFTDAWPGFAPGSHDIVDDSDDGQWWDGIDSAASLDSRTFPPVRHLVPGVLTLGGVGLLAGPPKAGKSMLAISLAYAVATNGLALGRTQVRHAGDVLIVSLDDRSPARMQRRLRMVANGGPQPAGLHVHLDELGRGRSAVDRLIAYLHAHPSVVLVVVDTIEHLRPPKPGGIEPYSADVAFLNELRRVIDIHPGVSLLCLAHTRKPASGSDDDPISAVTGTHGVTGGADHVMVISGTRGVPTCVLHVVSRDADDASIVLTFDHAHGWQQTDLDADDPTVTMTRDDAAVYRALSAFPEGATARELEPECEDVVKIGNRLASLLRRGHVRRLQRGKYTVC